MASERLKEAFGVLIDEGIFDVGEVQALARSRTVVVEPKDPITLSETAKFRTKKGEKFYPRHPKDPMSRGQAGAIYGIAGGKAARAPWLTAGATGLTLLSASGVINAMKKGYPVIITVTNEDGESKDVTLTPAE